MSSFYIVLEAKKSDFKGMITRAFSKPYRLRGDWEVGVSRCFMANGSGGGPFWIFSNVVDYTYVNEVPMQLVDIVDDVSSYKNNKPMYVKLISKHFSSINVQFKQSPTSEQFSADLLGDIVCILHFRKA